MKEFIKERIDIFCYMTISSIAINTAMQHINRHSNNAIMLVGGDEISNEFRQLLKENTYGGYSSVLGTRYEVAGFIYVLY